MPSNGIRIKINHFTKRFKTAIVHIRRRHSDIPQRHRSESTIVIGIAGQLTDPSISCCGIIHFQSIDKSLCRKEIQTTVALIATRDSIEEQLPPLQF